VKLDTLGVSARWEFDIDSIAEGRCVSDFTAYAVEVAEFHISRIEATVPREVCRFKPNSEILVFGKTVFEFSLSDISMCSSSERIHPEPELEDTLSESDRVGVFESKRTARVEIVVIIGRRKAHQAEHEEDR